MKKLVLLFVFMSGCLSYSFTKPDDETYEVFRQHWYDCQKDARQNFSSYELPIDVWRSCMIMKYGYQPD